MSRAAGSGTERSTEALRRQIAALRARADEAEETLRAIRSGEVDALTVSSPEGDRIFTLSGADHSYRVMVEAMHDGTAVLAPDGGILYANGRFAEMLHGGLEHVIGLRVETFLAPDSGRDFAALLAQARSGPAHREIVFKTLDGQVLPALVAVTHLAPPDVQTDSFVVVVSDLTEISAMQSALRSRTAELEHKNRALQMLSILNHHVVHDKSTGDLLRAACETVVRTGGYRLAWIGQLADSPQAAVRALAAAGDIDSADLASAEDPAGDGPVARALREGSAQLVRLQDAGHAPWGAEALRRGCTSVMALPMHLNGGLFGAFAIYSERADAFDATEQDLFRQMVDDICFGLAALNAIYGREQAEQALRNLNAQLESRVARRTLELESAVRDLESFSYSVSHDLRQPLRAVDNFANILLEDHAPKLDAEGQRVIGVIRRNVAKMAQMIDDILAFSRAGRKALSLETVDMDALAREVYEELRAGNGERAVEFRPSALPPVRADPAALRQVWTNLLSNALKFTRGRAPAVIEVSGRIENGECIYSVRDNGVGFDPRFAEKLFGVFQRLHSAEAFEGSGIGLAIVKRFVDKHGGRVWAEGEPDKGASFHFALPQQEAAADAA